MLRGSLIHCGRHPSQLANEPDDTTDGTSITITITITITTPEPGDPKTLAARFTCTSPGNWTATGTLGRSAQVGLVITHLEVEPARLPGGEPGIINSTTLRQLSTGAILHAAATALLDESIQTRRRDETSKPSPGRAPLTDELLRRVAEGYLRETAAGKPRGGIKRLAEEMGRPTPTVARWVSRAREAGWLGPAVPGREGGEPGPRLLTARAADA